MVSKVQKIATPLAEETLSVLRAGDEVLISGVLYTARDQAHRRLVETIESGGQPPFDLRGQVLFYAGPTPGRDGQLVGVIGPTTSSRLDVFTPFLLEQGIRGMIGKGRRSETVREAIRRHQGIYLAAVGGIAAYLSRFVTSSELVAYEDLGPEAIYRLEVQDLPAVVAIDSQGHDLYEEAALRYRKPRNH